MNKIFLAVILTIALNSKTFAQQMIPGQTGVEFSYSVFPKSPEKQNYALSVGLVSYQRNGNYFFGLAEYSIKYYEYTNYNIPIDNFLLGGGYSFMYGETSCAQLILILESEVLQVTNRLTGAMNCYMTVQC